MPQRVSPTLAAVVALLIGIVPRSTTSQSYGQDDRDLSRCLSGPSATQSSGMTDCVIRAANFWTHRMNRAYRQLLALMDPASRSLLEKSQSAWTTYRASELAFGHGPWSKTEGTAGRLNDALLRVQELRTRALLLEGYLLDR